MEKKLKEIVGQVLGVPPETLSGNSSPDNVDGWDSIKSMNIILALEEEFRVEFNDEEISTMLNFGLIHLTLEEALKRVG